MSKEIRTCRCGQQYTILYVHDSNETPKDDCPDLTLIVPVKYLVQGH